MTKQQHIQRGSANGYAECECAQCQTFTAGPWARSENDTFKIVNSYGSVVAECRYFGAAQRHANAKLIAAAPELLAACQEAECLFAHGVVSQCSLTETSDRNIEAAKKSCGRFKTPSQQPPIKHKKARGSNESGISRAQQISYPQKIQFEKHGHI